MNLNAADTVRALIELSKTLPHGGQFLREVRDGLTAEVGSGSSVIDVVITTPTGDAGDLKQAVKEMLKSRFKKPVQITEKADKSLIGGAIVMFGDERIDLSVRGSLTQAVSAIGGA